MQQVKETAEERVKIQPYCKENAEPEKAAKPPRLSLKYLEGLIETLQEDHHRLSIRVDELSKQMADGKDSSTVRNSAEWAVASLPVASEERLPDGTDPESMESILQELKEAARIADEIAEHAAAGDQPNSMHQGTTESLSPFRASEAETPGFQSPQYAHFSPISTSRTERHHRRKLSFWSRLFGRATK